MGAQESPDPGPPRAGAHLELGGGLAVLHRDLTPTLHGAALVGLSSTVALGGGGTVFPSERDVEGDVVFPDRALGFGYGGILVEVGLPHSPVGADMVVRTLLGAGNADLRDRRTGTALASDNVAVVEPGVILRRRGTGRLDLGVSLSWRAVFGLDDVEGVDSGDLSGLALGVHVRLGPL